MSDSLAAAVARRRFLQVTGAGLATLSLPRAAWAREEGKSPLIVREASPLNAEAPLHLLPRSWTTPTELLFVRSHSKKLPQIDPKDFRLKIEGMVDKPQELSLADLAKMGKLLKTHATLTCAGNRREEHSAIKKVGGVQWGAGAIGNVEWEGVSLRDVLAKIGVKPGAKHVWFEGLDEVEHGDQVEPFGGSIPLQRLSSKNIPELLATRMNGAPLTIEHGFPLRAVVPGYIGARSVKWLGKIVVSDRPSPNHYLADAYKIVQTLDEEAFAKAEPIYGNVLNSAICLPAAGESLQAGKQTIAGWALPSGDPNGLISKVEVSLDGGDWQEAKLENERQPFCWALWQLSVDLPRGKHKLTVRATDALKNRQPEKTEWNAKGYLYNGWHSVEVMVDA